MSEKKYPKYEEIHNRLAIVKSACLIFTSIICFKALCAKMDGDVYTWIYSFSMLLMLVSIYGIWNFVVNKNLLAQTILGQSIENILLCSAVFIMLMITGGHQSSYKFIFLVIIITSTIQFGKKYGMGVAVVVSSVILGIDLLYGRQEMFNMYFEDDLILVGIFLLTAWVLGVYVTAEKERIDELQKMVHYDGLTGVYNHRYFYQQLQSTVAESKQAKTSVGLLFLDIDHFKEYNDINGHQAGDGVLNKIGTLLREQIGDKGLVARYGGEEFAVLLPQYSQEESCKLAEVIRKQIEDTYFEGQENQPESNLTISIGVSSYPYKAKDEVELVKSADDALYRAKFFNKNRVETYSSILDELEKNIDKEQRELMESVKTLIGMINAKDRYTYGHTERVVLYSKVMAECIGLNKKDTRTLVCGAYIHDIGKMHIDKDILVKRMPLTELEWQCLKEHPAQGVEIIKHIGCLDAIQDIVRHHHERYDGKGYPDGLKGEDIPYLARVLTVLDSFDAMTSNRSYNKRKSYEEAIEELRRCKGTQFDPEITEQFIVAFNIKNGSTF
ncbi:MAG: bifunctional diguanylate cyclase/phosphohydrolase [Cellulosilyticaceae bacterium]